MKTKIIGSYSDQSNHFFLENSLKNSLDHVKKGLFIGDVTLRKIIEDNFKVTGTLEDRWGSSSIEGEIKGISFNFIKSYHHPELGGFGYIKYELKQGRKKLNIDNSIACFIGKWSAGNENGSVICTLFYDLLIL